MGSRGAKQEQLSRAGEEPESAGRFERREGRFGHHESWRCSSPTLATAGAAPFPRAGHRSSRMGSPRQLAPHTWLPELADGLGPLDVACPTCTTGAGPTHQLPEVDSATTGAGGAARPPWRPLEPHLTPAPAAGAREWPHPASRSSPCMRGRSRPRPPATGAASRPQARGRRSPCLPCTLLGHRSTALALRAQPLVAWSWSHARFARSHQAEGTG
ncbi:unnamed protein product [Urochloa humidicola]